MTKYAGKDFLLKLGTVASPTTFDTVSHQRTTSGSINNEQIDVTDKDGSRWRKLLEGGVRSMSVSSSGLVSDAESYKELLRIVTEGEIREYQLIFADAQTFTGRFQLTSTEFSGEYTDAQNYSITLESADDITYSES